MTGLIDLTGMKFGRLDVISINKNNGKRIRWLCHCECGKEIVVDGCSLRTGNTKSCGCLKKEIIGARRRTHGKANTRVYRIWTGIHTRCTNKSDPRCSIYGGRGIKVCERWNCFENFLADMGEPPDDTYSIDRIDPNGDYEPNNCRWSTAKQQSNNRRNNHRVEYQGKTQTLAQWSEETGISSPTLSYRLRHGWSASDALKVFPRKILHGKGQEFQYMGISLTLSQWAERMNMRFSTLRSRLDNGWSIDDALSIPVNVKASCKKSDAEPEL